MALSTGRPAWVLPSTLPCGVRTFLERCHPRSPGRLLRTQSREPDRPYHPHHDACSCRHRVVAGARARRVRPATRRPGGADRTRAAGTRSGPRGLRRAPGRRRVHRRLPRVTRSRSRGAQADRGRPRSAFVGPMARRPAPRVRREHPVGGRHPRRGVHRRRDGPADPARIGRSVRIGPVPVRTTERRPDRPRPGSRRPRHADPDRRRDLPRRGPAAQRCADVRQHPALPPPGARGGWPC